MSTVAILSTGEMGSNVALRLRRAGSRVVTCLAGRSSATAKRAREAGVDCLPNMDAVVREADLAISLVTSFGASPLASDVAAAAQRSGRAVLFVEANSINPARAAEIAATIEQAGGRAVDGCIIGSAGNLDRATFYLAGEQAGAAAAFIEPAVKTQVLGPSVGQASGLKILNAGLTKGLAALGVELLLAAQRLDLLPVLLAKYRAANPEVAASFASTLPGLASRAARRAQEMSELADTFESLGLTAHMGRAARNVLEMVAERCNSTDAVEWRQVLDALSETQPA